MSEPAALSLYVVSDELNETLRHAQVALEDALEGRGTGDALQRCAEHLHEARGVLQMVEIYGAALLAEEMEAVCVYLSGFKAGAKGQEDGLDALTRSMVQMPAYLERMLAGGRDIALVLLPMLNDLRAVRGKPLLSESTLLLIKSRPESDDAVGPARKPSGEDVVALAQRLRPAFQLALLGWIQGQHAPEHLAKLARVADSLEQAAEPDALHRLWWVVGAVLEALREGNLETSVSIKRLLGQADREMKRLIDNGLEAYVAAPAVDLLNNLLYYVARATGTGDRVSAVRSAFNLSGLLPGDKQVEEARAGLAAPGAKLMQTVAAAIREDLARVKDVLDIYVRTGSDSVDELTPQLAMLKKISDTLGVLGLGDLRGDIQREVERLRTVVEDGQSVDDATLIQIAATLLRVEDSLDQQLTNLVKPLHDDADDPQSDAGGDDREQVDFKQVTHAVVRECLINLARLKEAISRLAANHNDRVGIENAGTLIRGVTAGLLMLDKERAMDVAERILTFVDRALKHGRQPLSPANLDRLADAVVSLEYYLETIQVGRSDPWYMLDNAETCLEILADVEVTEMKTDVSVDVGVQTMRLSPDDINAALAAEGADGEQQTEVLGAPSANARAEIISIPVVAEDAEHPDPELLELFIEESKEEIQKIRKHLPKWIDDPDDSESLITIRRSFHTLKGSGRMVGAERIGEYCWTIEDLLNRLINRTLTRTPPMVEFIDEAAGVLPALVEQIEVGAEPAQDIAFLMARAGAFAEGDPNAATMNVKVLSAEAAAEAALEMDPVLLDIFAKETAGHILVVKNFLKACEGHEAPFDVPENLHRACHTLHGSLNMANVDRGIEITAALNRLVRRHFDNSVALGSHGTELVGSAVEAIETVVAEINRPKSDRADHSALIEQMNTLTDSVTQASLDSVVVRAIDDADDLDFEFPIEEISLEDSLDGSIPGPSKGLEEAVAADVSDDAEAVPEPAPVAAGPNKLEVSPDDEYDAEIAAIFTEEAGEILEATDAALMNWAGGARAAEPLAELKRHLHTLKGGARMAGVASMGNLSHEFETVLIAIEEGRVAPSDQLDQLLQQCVDELHRMRDGVVGGQRVPSATSLEARLKAAGSGATDELVTDIVPVEETIDDRYDDAPQPVAEVIADEESGAQLVVDLDAGDDIAVVENIFEIEVEGDLDVASPPEAGEGGITDGAEDDAEPEPSAVVLAEIQEPDAATPAELTSEEAQTEPEFAGTDEPAEAEAGESDDGFDPESTIVSPTGLFVELSSSDELQSLVDAGAVDLQTEGEQDLPVADAVTEPSTDHVAAARVDFDAPAAPLPMQRSDRESAGRPGSGDRQEYARIDAELLEDLLNASGEISIYHSRLAQQVTTINFNLLELEQTVSRLRSQLRKLEIETEAQILNRHQDDSRDDDFDPLELDRYSTIQQLSRALAESANDVGSIKDLLQSLTGDADTLLVQQSRVTAELQDGLMRTRMVPFQRHVPRLTRLVRQTAAECGKQAELQVEGANGELDRQVLEKMLAPFEHMLRNAVVHGIESSEYRQAGAKPPIGRITVRLHREGSEMVIDVSDDGAGLDVAAIRSKAFEEGLLAADARISDEEVMELILTPGFSTAGELTQSAGRGVGMDVVANEIKKLGGSLRITSIPKQGTNFTIRLPFTLAITQALIVRCGDETFALPLPTVEGVARVPRSKIDEMLATDDAVLEYGEQAYRLQHLGLAVGGSATRLPDDDSAVPLILVRSSDKSIAILTDEMLTSREIVVKSVGPQLASVRGLAGATILGDGSVVLILDVSSLVRGDGPIVEIRDSRPAPVEDRPLILVVDDSITVRRVTERFLQRRGLRVQTAKDGIDAIEKLQDEKPSVILLDIEMPRMDGYEFATHVRNDERFADTPIIMITSRVSEKHKARAIEIGVNDYLGKPYQDYQLLEAMERYLNVADEIAS